MKQLLIKPQIHKFDRFSEFAEEFSIGKNDLIFTNEFIYEPYMKELNLQCDFLFGEKYGEGEPSDLMINKVLQEIKNKSYKRIVAIGGGTIIDIGKILALEHIDNVTEAFEKKIEVVKEKELIIVPTTCGTGSEVTNISIAEIKEKGTKMGLACDELYADYAVLIPELLKTLPFKFFMCSSVDALIHAVESYVSPKSNPYTEMFSSNAINMIINGYLKIINNGQEYRHNLIEDFIIGSNYAGVAFANTGVGAVHALSYPLGGKYHVPHGEANYQFFTQVFKTYNTLNPDGKIKEINLLLSNLLNIKEDSNVFDELDNMLNKLLPKNKLRDYGMKEDEIELFTDTVIQTQQRLLVNNYVPLSREEMLNIYKKLY